MSNILPLMSFSNATTWASTAIGGTFLAGSLLPAFFLKHAPDKKKNASVDTSAQKHAFCTLDTTSKWSYLNPLVLLSSILKKLFSFIMTPYYLLFGEKENRIDHNPCPIHFEENENWMDHIPPPIHYQAFNGKDLSHLAQNARKKMQGLLEMMGAKEFMPSLADGTLPGWSGIDIATLPDEKRFSYGPFYLTGREMKKLASSLRVSYDPSVLSSDQLCNILVRGANSPQEEAMARGRIVSSLVASVCDSRGNPLSRNHDLPLYHVYTSNAPNLAYSPYDREEFVEDGTLNQEKYTKEMERIFLHYFEEAKFNKDNVVVLCGFGMGAFMTPEILPDGQKCFVEALRKAISVHGKHFEKIIFADPNKNLTDAISSIPDITVSNKSCLDVAHQGAKKGYKIALFNPGDGSGIPGQFWLKGHIALEEMFGLFTTLLVAQHPHCNPVVANKATYVART